MVNAMTVGIFPDLADSVLKESAGAGLVPATDNVVVRYISPIRGKGAFAKRALKKGSHVRKEAPLLAMQTNKHDVVACVNCFRGLGSVKLQLHALAGMSALDAYELYAVEESEGYGDDQPSERLLSKCVVPCLQACGELYCSEECREQDFRTGHRLLCVGPLETTEHPLYQFKMHALATNEEFLLAGKVIARIACAFAQTGDLKAAARDFMHFQSGLWWDVAVVAADGRLTRNDLRERAQESLALLREAFVTEAGQNDVALEPLFDLDCYGRLLGMFEMNNVGIRDLSPLPAFFKAVLAAPEPQRNLLEDEYIAMAQAVAENNRGACDDSDCDSTTENEDEDDWSDGAGEFGLEDFADPQLDLFPPLDGTGLFSLTASLNHSCEPNCHVEYVGSLREPLALTIVALSDINEGDELCISYIDAGIQDVEERARLLLNYGFRCACKRCEREQCAGK